MREENRYEKLYTQLLTYVEQIHQRNKRRIRCGLISLIALPVLLIVLLLMTGSSKVVFLIIWIIAMFIVAAYLISVEYLDDRIQKKLVEVSESEQEFDDLLDLNPDRFQPLQTLEARIRPLAGRIELPVAQRKQLRTSRPGAETASVGEAGPAAPESETAPVDESSPAAPETPELPNDRKDGAL